MNFDQDIFNKKITKKYAYDIIEKLYDLFIQFNNKIINF